MTKEEQLDLKIRELAKEYATKMCDPQTQGKEYGACYIDYIRGIECGLSLNQQFNPNN